MVDRHVSEISSLQHADMVRVFRGEITAHAHNASGSQNAIEMIGGKGKQRLDRRHHAVDGPVIALMQHKVA